MKQDTDRLVNWLVSGLELETTVFHVGQYCGSWRASTAGRARASFHLVLRGHCFLHLENRAPIELGPRDAVFLLRDRPHSLTPERQPGPACVPRPMQAMLPVRPDGTSLACGFFDFRGLPGELLRESFPDCLLMRADAPALRAITPLFDLVLAEADRDTAEPSPLIERLTELLLFYLIR
ncbi:MAG: cupin domain-containing protein, partial [Azoarcus sp.]|nr:cupin domain-containing protein [Azoarcus sp.]